MIRYKEKEELDYKLLGTVIREARIKKKLSITELAEKVGVTNKHIRNIETDNAKVGVVTLIKIIYILNISLDTIVADVLKEKKNIEEYSEENFFENYNLYNKKCIIGALEILKNNL